MKAQLQWTNTVSLMVLLFCDNAIEGAIAITVTVSLDSQWYVSTIISVTVTGMLYSALTEVPDWKVCNL